MDGVTIAAVSNAPVVVWGAGLEAQGAVRRLLALGAAEQDIVVAVDRVGKQTAALATMSRLVPGVVVGTEAQARLLSAEFVIASPSIPPANPLWARLGPHDTTTNMWLAEFGDRAVAVTGSKGKSMTTHLLGHLLGQLEPGTQSGGNIGVAFFDLDPTAPLFVVEVGSPQCLRLTHSPLGGALTSLFPEHLDFHGTVENYYGAKANLFEHGSQFVVTTQAVLQTIGDLAPVRDWSVLPDGNLWFEETAGFRTQEAVVSGALSPALRGAHNRMNALLALGVVQRLGYDLGDPRVGQGLGSLSPLAHRLEVVATRSGVEWVDDSLATAPQPTAAALAVYADRPVVLIVGGQDRGIDFGELARAVVAHAQVSAVITVPSNGPKIAAVIAAELPRLTTVDCADVAAAVGAAAEFAGPGTAVLFSPASPSDAASLDYRERSARFRKAIDALG